MASVVETVFSPFLEWGAREVVRQGDAALQECLEKYPKHPAAMWLEPLGGLRAGLTTHPVSATTLRQRLEAVYGKPVVDRMIAADPRLIEAVRDAAAVRAGLEEAQRGRDPSKKQVAFRHLAGSIEAHRFTYVDVLRAYRAAEEDPAPGASDAEDPTPADLGMLADMLWDTALGSPGTRVRDLLARADYEQAWADKRVAMGLAHVNKVVAYREVTFSGDDVRTTELLAPKAGLEDEDQAIAAARVAGVATAVVREANFSPLYYLLALTPQLEYPGVLSAGMTATTKLIPKGSLDVVALTTTSGYVMQATDGRYQGVLELDLLLRKGFGWPVDPGRYFRADAVLAALHALPDGDWPGDVYRPHLPLTDLFLQTVLDYTLLRLIEAETAMDRERARFSISGGDVAGQGRKLKEATAALRDVMYQLADLAWKIRDRAPTEAEKRIDRYLLERKGKLLATERTAAAFVEVERDHDDPPEEKEFTDLLAGEQDGDAALKAFKVNRERTDETIPAFRRHLFKNHPEAARRLGAVHPDVHCAFTAHQLNSIRIDLDIAELVDLAEDLGLGALEMMTLALGLVAPPMAIAAAGLSAVLGSAQMVEGFRTAEELTLMAGLDVPGGFTLASPADAESARRWAWIGMGLAFIDVLGFKADVGRALRGTAGGPARASALSQALDPAGPSPRVAEAAVAPRATPRVPRSALQKSAELANRETLAGDAFERVAKELGISRRKLRALLTSALSETSRATALALVRRAAGTILDGGLPKSVSIESVLGAGVSKSVPRTRRSAKRCLVIGDERPGLGWGIERLAGGTQTTLVVRKDTGVTKPFKDAGGEVLPGDVEAVPAGRQFDLGREDLISPKEIPSIEPFVDQRLKLLRPGGRHVIVTESREFAEALANAAPRTDARIWTVEYKVAAGGNLTSRYGVVIAKPRPRMVKLSSMVDRHYPEQLIQEHLALLWADKKLLQRKLDKVWATKLGRVGDEVPQGLLNNLTGNIAEILAKAQKQDVASPYPDGKLTTGVMRIRNGTDKELEFTDDMVVKENSSGHLEVLHVFEVKAGARGGQEATAQIFDSIENALEEGDTIVVDGTKYVYAPGTTRTRQVLYLTTAPRTIIAANGAENMGRMSAMARGHMPTDRIGLLVDGQPVTATQIKVLARRIIEAL